MIKNYLKIAWRNLIKNKAFSIINITGLATGLACFILIALYVVDELSYDRYNENAANIYRINADLKFGGTALHMAVSPDPMAPDLKNDYPEVEQYTRIYASSGPKLIRKGNQFINEQRVANVDSTFFDMFTLPAIAGDTKTALNAPNTVVITESSAKKYFGTVDALGKTIEADNTPYKVTAVIKDIPAHTHFNFDFLFSMANANYQMGNYVSNNFHSYIRLKKGTDYKKFEKNFDQVIEKYIIPQAKKYMNVGSMEEFKKAGNEMVYSLMPVTAIHLHSDRFPELSANGNMQYVYIFSAVALFILLIACINFMNLSTARSSSRAKEVGIRKVLGTERKTLIRQFLTESIVTVTISMIIALFLAWMVLPLFNDIAAKSITMSSLVNVQFLPWLLLLPLVVGIIAGSYPAFFLSRFKPIAVLKGKINTGFKKSNFRSSLVTFQFFTSIVLIISTVIVYKQLNYIQTKKLGFNKDQVLIIDGASELKNNAPAFKNDILALPGVSTGTLSSFLPVSNSSRNDNTYSSSPVMDQKSGFNMQTWTIDYDYLKTMGMEIIKGRNFSDAFGADSSATIINESTAKILGYDDPIEKKIYQPDGKGVSVAYNIIGVVKNFNFESLRQDIGPLSFFLGKSRGMASFKINTADVQGLVKQVEGKWRSMAPGMPFSYRFLDESFDDMYRSEMRIGKIAMSFAILAILIACLGLFGLSTYMAEQRTKEIGIRKVLGASVSHLAGMLSRDFLKLVLIAAVIAFPVAWWAMHSWLQDFAYRISISWWVFAIAAFVALLIALLTVSFQAIKAAIANPVKNLRTE